MRPKLSLLSDELVKQIIEEGFALLMNPGIQVHNDEALSFPCLEGTAPGDSSQFRFHASQ